MIEELFSLEGETAVVTGAGRGIGEGIAKVLASAGARVVCAARRADEIKRVAEDINAAGGRAAACVTDVTDAQAVQDLADFAVSEFGGLHMWVNNAGGSSVQRALHKLDREEWDRTLLLNLTAVWECTRIAAATMETGRILNISSLAAEDVIGSVLDVVRNASRSGMDVALGGGVQNVETSYEDDSFASPTVFHDARVVTVTWEGVAVLFFVATTATLVIGGAALFFAFFAESPERGDVLQTLSSAVKVSPGTRRALSRVMEAVSPVSPAGSARKVRARTASSNIF